MNYIEFKEKLKSFPVFSLQEIRKIDLRFHRRRLNEWQEKGYIKKIIRGYYIFSDLALDDHVLFEIANRIYSPSYISCEMALSYYSLIPESVYRITSVSTRKTYRFSTSIAEFSYRRMKPALFFGYRLEKYGARFFKIAYPEKSILDYFYFHSQIKSAIDFESLRLNASLFREIIDGDKLMNYLEKIQQKRLKRTTYSFMEYMQNA